MYLTNYNHVSSNTGIIKLWTTNVLLYTAMWKASRSTSCCKKHFSITTISITNKDKLHNIKHKLFLYMSGNAWSSGHCVSSKVFKLFIFHYYIFPFKNSPQAYTFVRDRFYYMHHQCVRGTRWRSWLRHCATNRTVAGSIPDGVIGIFHWHNLSGRTMALGLTQPLTEMSTRNIFWR